MSHVRPVPLTCNQRLRDFVWALSVLILMAVPGIGNAQVPAAIDAELRRLGQGVFPACTAKLYRPLMPAIDYNTYWPPDQETPATDVRLYPGVQLARDIRFGPHPKDLIDIFVGDERPEGNRTVLIYVPGGAGNKVEQQAPESNAFYDNIGRWATENGMVGVTMQRHDGSPPGQDIATMIEWLKANISEYTGDPDRMFIWAHSAGNRPLGGYIGRPDLYGIGVKGAIFMSGNPVTFSTAADSAGGSEEVLSQSLCEEAGGTAVALGGIRGPSSQLPDQGQNAMAVRDAGIQWNGREWMGPLPIVADGAGGRGRSGDDTTPQAEPGLTLQDGFRTTRVAIMIVYAELDPRIVDAQMPANAMAIHDELCRLEGPEATDGVGHCPTMFMAMGHSHVSEVFSIGTDDETVSGPILDWIESVD